MNHRACAACVAVVSTLAIGLGERAARAAPGNAAQARPASADGTWFVRGGLGLGASWSEWHRPDPYSHGKAVSLSLLSSVAAGLRLEGRTELGLHAAVDIPTWTRRGSTSKDAALRAPLGGSTLVTFGPYAAYHIKSLPGLYADVALGLGRWSSERQLESGLAISAGAGYLVPISSFCGAGLSARALLGGLSDGEWFRSVTAAPRLSATFTCHGAERSSIGVERSSINVERSSIRPTADRR